MMTSESNFHQASIFELISEKKIKRIKLRLTHKLLAILNKKLGFNYIPKPLLKLCKFLGSVSEIENCTLYLQENGYVSHEIDAKNWDIAHVIANLPDGNFLDMGSSDSYILKNVILKGIKGEKYGIDLREPNVPVPGVNYLIGNLTKTNLADNFFTSITCLSVIEHEVNFDNFAAEVARLLINKGRLYLTFDYWNPKIVSNIELYGLKWNPLSQTDVTNLVNTCNKYGLNLVQDIDWTTDKAVITPMNHSPDQTKSYTFGLLVFEKE
ncbi:methyltransferase domain-containing protein [Gloeothece verrucosa]|uniref:Methyltransferase type 11 n=1 Tax=Gloeothece verrucosa (strain PCC 7822) TaxID=497965 RepID=E0U825_GLOV7|nr:methyltransferase domain-containing protein [Gloeothece verrucosa]ADN17230.1 Methyltransferase type 11 [Gloeothece verrucosa PCC 7822]